MEICRNVARKIINTYESDTNFSPEYKSRYEEVTFKGVCLKQKSVSFLHKKVVNLYISYTLDKLAIDLDTDFTLGNCLFRAVKLTKNADPDKINTVLTAKDLIHVRNFHGQMEEMEKILLFLELIIVILCILIIEIEIY